MTLNISCEDSEPDVQNLFDRMEVMQVFFYYVSPVAIVGFCDCFDEIDMASKELKSSMDVCPSNPHCVIT